MLDYLIKNAWIVDGRGRAPFLGDAGIKKDRIAEIGKICSEARKLINAAGLYLAPGLIDIHTHSDFAIIKNPAAENMLMQGITTNVVGNCGVSSFPVRKPARRIFVKNPDMLYREKPHWENLTSYAQAVEMKNPAINIAALVGFRNLRLSIVGFFARDATKHEIKEMSDMLSTSMKNGAFGMSTGLIYTPDAYARTEEIIGVASALKEFDGIYASHIRNESDKVLEAVREAVIIGKEAKVSVEISHHKAAERKNFGRVKETLELMMKARELGISVNCDVYPYIASWTDTEILLPKWLFAKGINRAISILKNRKVREFIKRELKDETRKWDNMIAGVGWKNIKITKVRQLHNRKYVGMSIKDAAAHVRKNPIDFVMDLIISERGFSEIICLEMDEKDIEAIVKSPISMIASDSEITPADSVRKRRVMEKKPKKPMQFVHPRAYGTFPRVIAEYVRKKKLLRIEQAVCKMTGMPAIKLGLYKRGFIKEDYYADLVIFNLNTIEDRATYENPYQYPAGIYHVFVNGKPAVERGRITKNRNGRFLLKNKGE